MRAGGYQPEKGVGDATPPPHVGSGGRRQVVADDRLARAIFEAAMQERLLNDIRGWDRREWSTGDGWEHVVTGLREDEKDKWRRVAARVREAIDG